MQCIGACDQVRLFANASICMAKRGALAAKKFMTCNTSRALGLLRGLILCLSGPIENVMGPLGTTLVSHFAAAAGQGSA
eukprot:1524574-Pyramimonas_sp.AAC.1